MALIPVARLIALFERMYKEHWPYVWGSAEEGEVDCSGAFVWAYKQFGKRIAHGSNAIARGYVEGLQPVSEAVPGMAAFKFKKPGQSGYDLPAKYQKGGAAYNGDLNDYYHIGLVDETGKYVLNAQGTKAGFTRTKISAWGCVGRLNAVDYKKGDRPMQMKVWAESGTTVKMRSKPDKSGTVLANILIDTMVETGGTTGDWTAVVYDGREGYMMTKYLIPASESADAYVRTLTTEEYAKLADLRDRMEDGVKLLKSIVGVG